MQKEEDFERYTPQYPLPVDIASMSRQDTVCQFCGVSYLIHNEIKTLEAKCEKLEADLASYAGISSREAVLEQKLQNERTKISDLESTININTHKLNEITRKFQLIQDQLEQSEIAHKQTRASISKYFSNLRSTITQMQKEYLILQVSYAKDIQNWKLSLQTSKKALQKELQSTMMKYTNQHQIEIKQLKEIQQSQFQSHTTAQNDLEAAREEIRLQQDELVRLRQQLSQNEQYSQQLEQQISKQDHLIDQHRQQLTNENELRSKTNLQLENVRAELVQLTTEQQKFEINESNSRRKIDEINRSRQAVLDRTRDEYEKLLRKYTDLDEVYRELVDQRERDTFEFKTIRSELERLHHENIELNKQRETLHITHDIQMKKLHETYSSKLREAEQWPDRLQTALNREREQHQIQINELEHRLRENFLTELNIEKQKSADLLRKSEHDSGYSTKQLRHELISTEKVTIEQRQYYTKQIEQLEKEKDYFKQELDTLRDVLKELHEQLNRQESMNNNHQGNYFELKEDLLAKDTHLFHAKSMIEQLQKELEQTREEMTTLQETVHRECTEREQLKDALIDARQQLLTMKKNGVLNGTASRSLHSPPVAFEDIEKRVIAPLPYSNREHRNKIPSFVQSEPINRDHSIHGDAADFMARPMSSSQHVPYRSKPLLPIIRSQPSKQRRNGNLLSSTKSDQLLENQRRIARFIKHIK